MGKSGIGSSSSAIIGGSGFFGSGGEIGAGGFGGFTNGIVLRIEISEGLCFKHKY